MTADSLDNKIDRNNNGGLVVIVTSADLISSLSRAGISGFPQSSSFQPINKTSPMPIVCPRSTRFRSQLCLSTTSTTTTTSLTRTQQQFPTPSKLHRCCLSRPVVVSELKKSDFAHLCDFCLYHNAIRSIYSCCKVAFGKLA